MKIRRVLLISTGAAAIAFAGLAATVSALGTQNTAPEPSPAPAHYTVRAENGRITVYPGDKTQPELYADIDLSRLREYDRALLEQGIEIDGYEGVIGLLEDFSN